MAQALYMASWIKAGGTAWAANHGLTGAQYQARFNELTGQGFRPVCISGYTNGNSERFACIFDKSASTGWVARHGITAAQYQAGVDEWAHAGMRPLSLSAWRTGSGSRFACIYEKGGSGAWAARHGLDSAAYQQAFDQFVGQGYRLRGVQPYVESSTVKYIAWWEKSAGPPWVARHNMTEAQFRATHNSLAMQGYDLVSGGSAMLNFIFLKQDVYAGLWEKRSAASIGHHGMTGGAYQANFDAAVAGGFRPLFVSGALGALPVDVNLRFRIQRQQQSNWCWSAVSTSIRHYYQPASTLTQVDLVNQRRGRNDCGQPGPGADTDRCNKADNTSDVLNSLGHLAQMQNNSVSFGNLRSELAAGRPIFIRIEWDGGGRHAVVAAGVEDGNMVIMCDPGSSSAADATQGTTTVVAYDTLLSDYSGSGNWIGTGYTKA
ncbi:papain-like cysteine protease family protein [Sandarakinorhabdus oryzae]|uniref:papain-like cysteine protease family protein n=1 Tax=Sandarakinorhabdus oryzae TaxID=2675220 RepID=UPI0012E237BE|nr:papain-like cysteine protease family protein [Sandarakinorhabdus oryzae]